MAEAIGLAIGVLGLVGVFKDCIDLISCISTARSLGHDYQLLNARLDIEKTLLLQWAHRVRLLKSDYDVRLDDTSTHAAVVQILSCIQLLLSKSEELKSRYGLKQVVAERHDADECTEDRALSTSRMQDFDVDIKAFDFRINSRRKHVSLPQKVRWAVHDKEKFETLVGQVSNLTSKLGQAIPDIHHASPGMTEVDINKLINPVKIRLIRDAASEQDADMARPADEKLRAHCRERVLHSIWFHFMDERRDAVATSHPKTFDWAFEPPRVDAEWDSLSDWLSSGAGIYWMSGKVISPK